MKRKARERLAKRAAGSFPSYLYKSLDELESAWGEPPPGSSELIEDCHSLHRKPLLLLSDREAALCLQQRIGLTWIRTLVLQRLRQEPMRLAETYDAGDLLRHALLRGVDDWGTMAGELREIADATIPHLPETPDYLALIVAYQRFNDES